MFHAVLCLSILDITFGQANNNIAQPANNQAAAPVVPPLPPQKPVPKGYAIAEPYDPLKPPTEVKPGEAPLKFTHQNLPQHLKPPKEQLDVEIALFFDHHMYRRVVDRFGAGNADAKLAIYAGAIMSLTQHMYRMPSMKPKIDVRLVHYEVWHKRQPERYCDHCIGYEVTKNKANGMTYFNLFRESPEQVAGRWDAAFLITGIKDLNGVLGWTIVGGICDLRNRASLISVAASISDLPHELAHMLNMNHDDEEESTNPTKDRIKRGFVWSAKRIQHLTNMVHYLDSAGKNCLRFEKLKSVTHIAIPKMPSDLFNAEMQCQWESGNLLPYHDPAHHQDEWCSGIWCKERGKDKNPEKLTTQTIYGTSCGHKKICSLEMDWSEQENRCIDQNNQFTPLDRYNYAYGECPGFDINTPTAMTLEQCAAHCDATRTCKSFMYHNNLCTIKSSHCDLKLLRAGEKAFQFYLKKL